jgi:hypothetical protein
MVFQTVVKQPNKRRFVLQNDLCEGIENRKDIRRKIKTYLTSIVPTFNVHINENVVEMKTLSRRTSNHKILCNLEIYVRQCENNADNF